MDRVAVFVDVQNIYYTVKQEHHCQQAGNSSHHRSHPLVGTDPISIALIGSPRAGASPF